MISTCGTYLRLKLTNSLSELGHVVARREGPVLFCCGAAAVCIQIKPFHKALSF